ncbi:histidine phosphatase family protein [Pseudomonas chlororaphis]|uniref:histidine phosphatase family protein n=1 Tax=Pseudomonas chlororaphis TaxID=587753 RepID=UPI0015DFF3C3|nr:histidine phosphatase family protein [Pseudomonas chlororaphis]QLL12290.1 histidine phosphatase family protein [Pseudomonas chlororaphis subsp. aurantiaca]
MFIVILRHGETPQNLSGVFQGQSDPDLHEVGVARFLSAARVLREQAWDGVYSSHYRRAMSSADLLADATQALRFVCADLAERNLGELDGQAKSEQLQLDPQLPEKLMKLDYAPPGGESGQAALQRFIRAIEAIAANNLTRTLVVSHGGVIALFAHHVLGVPAASSFLEHGHGLMIRVSGKDLSLLGVNFQPESIVADFS